MALPEFQRGFVWGREQVRGLFQSLYRGHPVGSLLVWATDASTAAHRGEGVLAPGVVKLLLDGQQRITSLYGVIRGRSPRFFDGNEMAFTDLRFNLETEEFQFWQPIKMRDDPLWIDVPQLIQRGKPLLQLVQGHDRFWAWCSRARPAREAHNSSASSPHELCKQLLCLDHQTGCLSLNKISSDAQRATSM